MEHPQEHCIPAVYKHMHYKFWVSRFIEHVINFNIYFKSDYFYILHKLTKVPLCELQFAGLWTRIFAIKKHAHTTIENIFII